MSGNGSNNRSNSSTRNPYRFSDFSLRRLLLQGARVARGSPQLGSTRFCDVERAASNGASGGSESGVGVRNVTANISGSRPDKASATSTSSTSRAATGSVGPTVTVHASGSTTSGSNRVSVLQCVHYWHLLAHADATIRQARGIYHITYAIECRLVPTKSSIKLASGTAKMSRNHRLKKKNIYLILIEIGASVA